MASLPAVASSTRPLLRSPASALGVEPSPGRPATAATVSRQVAITDGSKSLQPCGGGTGVADWPGRAWRPSPPESAPGPWTSGGDSGLGTGAGLKVWPAAVPSKLAHPDSSRMPQASGARPGATAVPVRMIPEGRRSPVNLG